MLLLITGCINVNEKTPYVTITEAEIRLKDYLATIQWALDTKMFNDIVFCENSRYPLDTTILVEKAKALGKRFEYLTFHGNVEKVIHQGKGYGEGEIVEYVLAHSKLVPQYKGFCKITGRLKVTNVDRLFDKSFESDNLFMNRRGEFEVDTRFYYVKIEDYNKYLCDSYKKVNDGNGFFLEHSFYQDLHEQKVSYRMFRERPLFQGIAGSTGRIYHDKRSNVEKYYDLLCRTNLYNSHLMWKCINFVNKIVKRKRYESN